MIRNMWRPKSYFVRSKTRKTPKSSRLLISSSPCRTSTRRVSHHLDINTTKADHDRLAERNETEADLLDVDEKGVDLQDTDEIGAVRLDVDEREADHGRTMDEIRVDHLDTSAMEIEVNLRIEAAIAITMIDNTAEEAQEQTRIAGEDEGEVAVRETVHVIVTEEIGVQGVTEAEAAAHGDIGMIGEDEIAKETIAQVPIHDVALTLITDQVADLVLIKIDRTEADVAADAIVEGSNMNMTMLHTTTMGLRMIRIRRKSWKIAINVLKRRTRRQPVASTATQDEKRNRMTMKLSSTATTIIEQDMTMKKTKRMNGPTMTKKNLTTK